MVNKGDFAQQANAEHGKKIKDAKTYESRKGETTTTIIERNSLGKTTKTVVVL